MFKNKYFTVEFESFQGQEMLFGVWAYLTRLQTVETKFHARIP